MSIEPEKYEFIGRAWADVTDVSNSATVEVEVVDMVVMVTAMNDKVATAVKLPVKEVKALRNALNRALARVDT